MDENNRFNAGTPNFRTIAAQKIVKLFPGIVSDGQIDFDELREILSPDLEEEDGSEKYGFTWRGRRSAERIADAPATQTTLISQKDKSENWNNTKNVYIEGDNLEVLKLLQRAYSDKVQMIYIDPPYNTGSDFIYKDNYHDEYQNYLLQTGQIDENGDSKTSDKKASGRLHTNWLNMIYPRLKLARRLLKEDGVLFVSIDDHEQANLVQVLNDIFGEQNYMGMLVWKSRAKPANQGEAAVRPQGDAEYVLVYGKNINKTKFLTIYSNKKYKYPYTLNGRKYRLGTILKSNRGTNNRESMNYEFHGFTPSEDQRWQAGPAKLQELWDNGEVEFKNGKPFRRYFADSENGIRQPFYNFIPSDITGTSESGKSRLNKLIGNKHGFDTVKPVALIRHLIKATTNNNDLILDFFAGSSTTADAIFQQNVADGGQRRFILVQLDDKQETVKSSFESVTSLGEERIKKAAEESLNKNQNIDAGFRVYKLSSSTIKHWDEEPDKFEQQLELIQQSKFTEESSDEERAREIAIKDGVELEFDPIVKDNIFHFCTKDKELFVVLGDYDSNLLQRLNHYRKLQNTTVVLEELNDGSEVKFNIMELLKQDQELNDHFSLEWI